MSTDSRKKESYKRKQRAIKETRRQFFLTLFDKKNKEKYVEKEINGFLVVRSYSKDRKLFIVRVYDNEDSKEFKDWLKEFTSML